MAALQGSALYSTVQGAGRMVILTQGVSMPTHHLPVTRTARYSTLGPETGNIAELWVVLHGYAQLSARFQRDFAALDDGATLIVAPEALSRFYLETGLDGRHGEHVGATWLTREDRDADLADHLGYLDGLVRHLMEGFGSWRPRLSVLGFSQGSVMAARWVALGALHPARLILWGTPLPRDLLAEQLASRLGATAVTFVAGRGDPFVPAGSIEAHAEALQGLGATARALRFEGGHAIDQSALLAAAGRTAKA
jgi:predicted esterase